MSEKKQTEIEEMVKAVCHLDRTCDECMASSKCKAMIYAKRFYDTGYRKTSDVAAEIFEEIYNALLILAKEYAKARQNSNVAVCEMVHYKVMRPIEKKYTEEGK